MFVMLSTRDWAPISVGSLACPAWLTRGGRISLAPSARTPLAAGARRALLRISSIMEDPSYTQREDHNCTQQEDHSGFLHLEKALLIL